MRHSLVACSAAPFSREARISVFVADYFYLTLGFLLILTPIVLALQDCNAVVVVWEKVASSIKGDAYWTGVVFN